MEFKFNGINIYSKKPEVVFEFYKKLGFRVLEEGSPDDKWYGAMLALQEDENEPMIWIWRQGERITVLSAITLSFLQMERWMRCMKTLLLQE